MEKGGENMPDRISETQWRTFEENGYLHLGQVLDGPELAALQQRIDDIMLGRAAVDCGRLLMQLDPAQYTQGVEQTHGFKGATLSYRKIQNLELDPLFLAYLQRPLFRELSARVYGPNVPIACFRAMFMNKPARHGTLLPWHQDAWTHLDRQPRLTVWTALDPATQANGCVQVIPGSHNLGLVNPDHPSGFLTEEQTKRYCPEDKIVYLELQPGEAVVLHNWLLHRSDANGTDTARRAFSVCYMDARTRASNGETFVTVFDAMPQRVS
jgi:ectoine hydroxylase-related dioxygenase (phytanoyl-CoA dioxygenase family)